MGPENRNKLVDYIDNEVFFQLQKMILKFGNEKTVISSFFKLMFF